MGNVVLRKPAEKVYGNQSKRNIDVRLLINGSKVLPF